MILDRIILLESQWEALRQCADEVVEHSGLGQKEILRKLEERADGAEAPMCWTQLAQEEVTVEELNARIKGADGVITCWTNIPDQVIEANPQLRYLGFWTNLVDHRVNRDLAERRAVHITYIPDYGTDSVAEMAIAGMLAVSRHLLEAAQDTRKGSWAYELLKAGKRVPSIDQIPQRLLRGRRLGLLGFGRIGQRVAEIALAFGMEIAYWSRKRRPEWEGSGAVYLEQDALFKWADILSVHLSPYSEAKTVSREKLSMLHDGALLVNTSAGRLVDQEALWAELQSRRLNAYLDVYEALPPRKLIADLMPLNNLFTYRAGWFTQEAVTFKGNALVSNLHDYLAM